MPTRQHVRVDPNDLDRIIGNLIDNAVEHGTPPITVRAGHGDNRTVDIRVRDHGPGFDPNFLPHAFDRFTRADTARTTGGTGLGLAIVDTLTQRNHGTATAHNHPNGGAEMTIQLRAIDDAADPRASSHWQSQEQLGTPIHTSTDNSSPTVANDTNPDHG